MLPEHSARQPSCHSTHKHTHTHTASLRPTNSNAIYSESTIQLAMTTATTQQQQLIIKSYTCINLHEQTNDLPAECYTQTSQKPPALIP
jgi:hypothetical protein